MQDIFAASGNEADDGATVPKRVQEQRRTSEAEVALLVVPFSVIVGLLQDKNMDLNLGLLNTVVLLMGTLVTLTVLLDGRANWLKGYMLMAACIFIAVLYWFVPPTDNACD